MELAIILLLRIIVPFTILRWPLGGVVLCILVDAYDYETISQSFIGYHNYQYVDKFFDTYYLLFMAYKSLSWADRLAAKVSLSLVAYRVIGVLLFFVTGREYLLFFFPNLFLDFYLFYAVYVRLTGSNQLITSKLSLITIGGAILLPKLLSEYTLHVSRVAPIDLPPLMNAFYALPNITQTLMYMVPALLVLAWYVAKANRLNSKGSG